MLSFSGRVTMVDSPAKLRKMKKFPSGNGIAGFDTETRPSFRKGLQYPCSLVQVAFEEEVILIRLNKIGFPSILSDYLSDEGKVKIGIAIRDDIRQLQYLSRFSPASFMDLNEICPAIGFESIGAKRLTALILGKKISKRQQVSNWDARQLTEAQIRYAATDAWVCREIYLNLERKGLLNQPENGAINRSYQ